MTFWPGRKIVSRHFGEYRQKFEQDLGQKKLYLFLDFDGTLTPIAPRPQDAHLDEFTRASLEILTRSENCQVAVVSGRSLADLRKKVSVPDAIYVGNHGFEIEGPGIRFENNTFPQCYVIFQAIMREVSEKLSKIEGIISEDKGITFSIHYRLVDERKAGLVEEVIQKAVRPFVVKGEVTLRKGKKVFEVRPPIDWDKGHAVLWLLRTAMDELKEKRALAVYVGDDDTDEDAFKALNDLALTICVGEKKESSAQFYLRDTDEVQALVKTLADLREK